MTFSTSTYPVPAIVTASSPTTPEYTHITYLPYTYLIYDIEIVRAIPSKFEPPIPKIEYCDGWHDHQNMGVSVIGAYDSHHQQYRVFLEDNFDQFFKLANQRDLLVGFNTVKFDNQVLKSLQHYGELSPTANHYDILREIWLSKGLDPDNFNPRTHGGYSLDAISKSNGLQGKSGDGANAAILWQNGFAGSVIDYCLQDVHLTTRLFQQICCSAQLSDPKYPGRRLTLTHPLKVVHKNLEKSST